MAHPSVTDGHADVSSAACEIYGAAQATFNILYLNYCAEKMGIIFQMPAVLQSWIMRRQKFSLIALHST
jgi:hypothetical protein